MRLHARQQWPQLEEIGACSAKWDEAPVGSLESSNETALALAPLICHVASFGALIVTCLLELRTLCVFVCAYACECKRK